MTSFALFLAKLYSTSEIICKNRTDTEEIDKFISEFHERVLGIIPERRLD